MRRIPTGRHSRRPLADYLSPEHRDRPDGGCPSAALVSDAGRHGPAIQAAYAKGVAGYIEGFGAAQQLEATERGETLDPEEARRRLVDPGLSDEILAVSRRRHHQER